MNAMYVNDELHTIEHSSKYMYRVAQKSLFILTFLDLNYANSNVFIIPNIED